MKYMLIICGDEPVQLSQEEGAEVESSAQSWAAEMGGRGIRLDGNRLSPVSDATTVRVRGGEVLLGDGPFAETKEQIGGYDVIDCADLDEAIDVASKHPVAATSASGLLLASATLRPLEHDQRGCDDDQQYARYHVVDHAACLSISPRVATHPAAAAAGAGRASDRNHARWADLAVAFALISVESRPCDPTATSGAGSGLAGCFWHSFHSWPLLQLHPLRRKHITLSS
jgi:hypothetical protein